MTTRFEDLEDIRELATSIPVQIFLAGYIFKF